MIRDPSKVSVIVPTLGRSEQLASCLTSLLDAKPAPAEVIVVDQGGAGVARMLAARRQDDRIRVVEDDGRGAGRARNRGAQAARCDLVLFIDDDCRADPGWIGTASRLHEQHSGAMLTGQVLPGGDRAGVPSTREDPHPRDHTGTLDCAVLYSGNMAVARDDLLAFGGFDERFPSAGGEDNDLCYRWLRAGRALRFEPELIVVHMDWRAPAELEQVRTEYARTQGMFYAKHLRAGDLRMLSFFLSDLRDFARARLRGKAMPPPGAPAVGEELRSMARNWRRFKRN